MARTAWVLSDPSDDTSYHFAINPLEGGVPEYTKRVSEMPTVAPDGVPVLYEGQPETMKDEGTGTLLTKDQYVQLLTWWKKRRVVQLTDHLGRVMTVYITSFAAKPVKNKNWYKHTYTLRWYVLSITDLDELT
jgi:hypothetical protein